MIAARDTHAAAADPPDGSRVRRLHAVSGLLAPFRPQFANWRFWVVQLLIALIAGLDNLLDGLWPRLHELSVMTVTLFFVPVTYAALNFGAAGSAVTALWCALISVVVIVTRHPPQTRYEELFLLAAILGSGIVTGRRVEAERTARRRAEAAEGALGASETRYRGLFATSPVPVLLLDGDGTVREANPAAGACFGRRISELRDHPLADLLGCEPARHLLAAVRGEADGHTPLQVTRGDGRTAWVEPIPTLVADPWHGALHQVVLCDMTAEHRRHQGLQAYAGSILRGQEEERRRIAQELHDDTIQSLVIVCRQVDTLQDNYGLLAEGLTADLGALRSSIEGVTRSLRGFAHALRPSMLDDLGLVDSIRQAVEEARQQAGLSVRLRVRGEARRLPPDIELGVFRIAQEAVRNVERHACGSRLLVTLRFDDASVRLSVVDDGRGFSFPQEGEWHSSDHMGLLGMRERARMLGGSLKIASLPGRGTRVSAVIPVAGG